MVCTECYNWTSLLELSFAGNRFSCTDLQSDKKTMCVLASSPVVRMLAASNRATVQPWSWWTAFWWAGGSHYMPSIGQLMCIPLLLFLVASLAVLSTYTKVQNSAFYSLLSTSTVRVFCWQGSRFSFFLIQGQQWKSECLSGWCPCCPHPGELIFSWY